MAGGSPRSLAELDLHPARERLVDRSVEHGRLVAQQFCERQDV